MSEYNTVDKIAEERDPGEFEGSLVLRGKNVPDNFDGHAIIISDFFEHGEQSLDSTTFEERIKKHQPNFPQNPVLIVGGSIELTNLANLEFCPFKGVVSGAGMLSHGFIVVREAYQKFWGIPDDFIAVSSVDGCQSIKSGTKLNFNIQGDQVKILIEISAFQFS